MEYHIIPDLQSGLLKTAPSEQKKMRSMKNTLRPIGICFFWTAYFLYIAVVIRPDFLYYALITDGGYVYPPFLIDYDFFTNAIHYPGGIVWYLSSFLFQTYADPWLGALTVLAASICSFALSRAMIRRFFGFTLNLFAYAPAAIALIVMNRYGDPFPLLVNYNLSLVFSLMSTVWLMERYSRHWIVFPLSFSIVYFCTGGGAVLFTILVILFAFQNKHQGLLTTAAAFISLVTAILLYRYCDLRAVLQYALVSGGYPERRLMTDRKVFIDVPVIIASSIMLFCALLAPYFRFVRDSKKTATIFNKLSGLIGTIAVVCITSISLTLTRDEVRQVKVTFEYLDRVGKPGDVVAFVDKIKPARFDRFALFDLNRALSHQGLLGEKMFAYPQNPEALSLENPSLKFFVPVLMRKAELYYELGYLNLSKASVSELFEGSRIEHPAVIELLGKNALAHGRPAIATMWYRRLSHDLVYGRKAREVLRYLNGEKSFPELDAIESVRKNAIKSDTVLTVLDINKFCISLLAENPGNRMAFDYLIGSFLISGNIQEAARFLQRFREAGYERLPTHWAEALILYYTLNGITDSQSLRTVPQNIQVSFVRFMSACHTIKQRYEGMDRGGERYAREAPSILREEFGSTYFFYYFFHTSGALRWYR
jgi:hypothetical protein